jgi:hypothetical protein
LSCTPVHPPCSPCLTQLSYQFRLSWSPITCALLFKLSTRRTSLLKLDSFLPRPCALLLSPLRLLSSVTSAPVLPICPPCGWGLVHLLVKVWFGKGKGTRGEVGLSTVWSSNASASVSVCVCACMCVCA